MNLNAILAVLEHKGIISRAEGEKLVEFLNNNPQSTFLADAVEQIKELLKEGPKVALQTDLKSVEAKAEKTATAAVKAEAGNIVDQATTEASAVAEKVATDVAGANQETVKKTTDTTAKK